MKEEWEVIPKIKWAAWLLMSTTLIQVIFLVLVRNTFSINYFQHTPTVATFLIRSGFIIIVGIFMLRRYQWPRMVSLVLFCIGIIYIGYYYYLTFSNNQAMNAYGDMFTGYIFILLLVWGVSLYLLFSKEAGNWYKGNIAEHGDLTMDQL